MANRYRDQEQEQEEKQPGIDLGYEIPDVKNAVDWLTAAIQEEHKQEMEEDEKAKKAGKPRKRVKRAGGQICFCMSPSCTIGEFIQRPDSDEVVDGEKV